MVNGKLFIGNPSACVEVNRLKDYGIWQTSGAAFGINESVEIQLDNIIATIYSDKVSEELMLDRLSDNDIQIVIESLGLTEKGTPHMTFARGVKNIKEGDVLVVYAVGSRKILSVYVST